MHYRIILVLMVVLCSASMLLAAEDAAADDPHASGEKPSVFSGYYGEAIWTLVAFTLLVLILGKLAWKPLLSSLQSREQYIAGQISDAEKTRKDAEGVLVEYRQKLSSAEEEGNRIIANHKAQAKKASEEIIAKAGKEVEAIKLKSMVDLERSRIEAESELWVEAGDMVLKLGREVLGKTMTSDDNQLLIDNAIEKFKTEENR